MGAPTVLIVEDDPANMKLLSFVLAAHGYDVRNAADAEEALVILNGFTPRLVLMDLELPGMSGLDLTRKLKADPVNRVAVILAVTAAAMKGDEARAIDAGCDGYITKPFDTRALPGIVARYLQTEAP
jgi:CheY-like chemotaxis protein